MHMPLADAIALLGVPSDYAPADIAAAFRARLRRIPVGTAQMSSSGALSKHGTGSWPRSPILNLCREARGFHFRLCAPVQSQHADYRPVDQRSIRGVSEDILYPGAQVSYGRGCPRLGAEPAGLARHE